MKIFNTVEFTVHPPAMIAPVEAAIEKYAAFIRDRFPRSLWVTMKKQDEEYKYLTFTAIPDEETEQHLLEAPETIEFTEFLRQHVTGEPHWTRLARVASSHEVP